MAPLLRNRRRGQDPFRCSRRNPLRARGAPATRGLRRRWRLKPQSRFRTSKALPLRACSVRGALPAARSGSQLLDERRLTFEICGALGRSQRIRIAAPCICEFPGVRRRRLRRRAGQGRRAPRCWRLSGLSRSWPTDLSPRQSGAGDPSHTTRGGSYPPPTKSASARPSRRPADRRGRGPRSSPDAGRTSSFAPRPRFAERAR